MYFERYNACCLVLKNVYVSHNSKSQVLDLLIGHILNSNKNAYFIFGIFLYEIGSVITRKQFESHRRCMMLFFFLNFCCLFEHLAHIVLLGCSTNK